MDEFKTSQTDFSLPEGKNAPGAPAVQYGTETSGAPGPVTEPIKGESSRIDALQTSQQKKGEHHDPEGEN
jgi:hypothetical protein